MSYVNYDRDDPRAHTTPEEKTRHAREILALARRLVLEDQPSGVPACDECVCATIMLALGKLAVDVSERDSEQAAAERLGVAERFNTLSEMSEATAALLTVSAAAAHTPTRKKAA